MQSAEGITQLLIDWGHGDQAALEKLMPLVYGELRRLATNYLRRERTGHTSGYSIGSYEVLSFITRGGMGEVYLAQDKRLNRKVALKLLPEAYTKDNDRLRRFEQEARAASALNHPNIITIYEIFETDATHVIAAEFVEGETLRQRLARSSLTINEALNIAIQIADALAAAHKAGIIHRDIKPENVMLRPDGYVKVLDFGLAKLSEQTSPTVSGEAPTLQVRTGSGFVLGTAGYMSPEQARGLAVDSRSDIFSLGAVLYEMIARRKPFEGETPSDTLAPILKTEPPPLSHVAPQAPSELVRIVTKSLRKDREERYQVVKDLWLDLKALKQEMEFQAKLDHSVPSDNDDELTGTLHRPSPTAAVPTITESLTVEFKRHKLGAAVGLAIVSIVIALASFAIYRFFTRRQPVAAFQNIKLSRLTNSGDTIDATISPDGKYIVYVLSNRTFQSLWIRQVSTANDKQIIPPAPIGYFGMTFSPDGSDLYYAVKANLDLGTLYRVPVLGGPPVKVLDRIDAPVSFSPDGKQFVLVRGNYPNTANDGPKPTLWKVSINGGDSAQVTDHVASSAVVSPDGKLLAYTYPDSADPYAPPNRIAVVTFDGNTPVTTFGFAPSGTVPTLLQWSRDGKSLLYSVNQYSVSNVWSQPLDGSKPKQITEFNDGLMTGFAWSHDDKTFAAIRGSLLRDAVLITDLR